MDAVRELFVEYQRSLGVDLCFQGFEEELAALPGKYSPPRGALILAWQGDALAGCVGLRPLDDSACEMKRLYVRPTWRGLGLGARLAEASVAAARDAGYSRMYLDSLPSLQTAIGMYYRMGFTETAPYYHNPLPGVVYLEKSL